MNVVIIDLETIPDRTIWNPKEAAAPAPAPAPTVPAPNPLATMGLPGAVTVPGGVAFPGGFNMTGGGGPPAPPTPAAEPPKRGRGRPPKAATNGAPTNGAPAPAVPIKPKANGKDDFAPLYAHQICVIGYALISDDMPAQFGALQASNLTEERNLLAGFAGFLAGVPDLIVVGWNSRGFDIPVLELRSLRHGVAQGWYDEEARKRYGQKHFDLCDTLSSYGLASGGKTGLKLDTIAKLIGLPGKMGFDGSMVAAAVEAGKLAQVAAYCTTDVVQEACVYLRHRVMRGFLTPVAYNAAISAFRALWTGQPGFEKFQTDDSILLLPA